MTWGILKNTATPTKIKAAPHTICTLFLDWLFIFIASELDCHPFRLL
jgi:hypothetical protein